MNLNDFISCCSPVFDCTKEGLVRCAGALDKALVTPELHESNDYYGIASTIKKYVGIENSYPLKVVLEHGLTYNGIWKYDLAEPFPSILFVGRHRYRCLSPFTNKFLFAIGPALAYAEYSTDVDVLMRIKEKLGKVLLVFPGHSTHWYRRFSDIDSFCRELKKYYSLFDTIIISIYWRDVLYNKHITYMNHGFPCFCAGHIYDSNFLSNLKSIIFLADSTCSNQMSTASAYCLLMGKPHFYIKFDYHYNIKLKDTGVINGDNRSIISQFEKIFSVNKKNFFVITDEQREFADYFMGLRKVKTKEEMLNILALNEELNDFYCQQKENPSFVKDSIQYLKYKNKYHLAVLGLDQMTIMYNEQ